MAETWIAMMTRSRLVGWTSKLKGGPFAAWVKFLMTVKDCGKRGGVIRIDYLDSDWLRKNNVTLAHWSAMLAAAIENGAIRQDNGVFAVVKWSDYQRDPTGAERQKGWRERQAENGSNVSNGNNADRTGQDKQNPVKRKKAVVTNGKTDSPPDVSVCSVQKGQLRKALKATEGTKSSGRIELLAAGMNPVVAATLTNRFPARRVRLCCRYGLRRAEKNLSGMIRDALEQQWDLRLTGRKCPTWDRRTGGKETDDG